MTLYRWADGQGGHAAQVVYVAVEHEPHDSASDVKDCGDKCHGTSADYKAAWTHVRSRVTTLEAQGHPGMSARVKLAYCAVARNAARKAPGDETIGSGDLLYPGTENVDLLAHDVYNYSHFTQGGDGTDFNLEQDWKDPALALGDDDLGVVKLARAQGMKLFIGELGTHPGCPGSGALEEGCTGKEVAGGEAWERTQSRDDWFRAFADWLRTNDQQNTLVGFVYYHQKPQKPCPCDDAPKWNWQFTNTSPARAGAQGWVEAFVKDSTYDGDNAAYYVDVPFTI